MTNDQLIQFYNENIKNKSVEEISSMIYQQVGGAGVDTINRGIAKHLNDSEEGRDVKDDLTKLSLLLNAEREKMMTAEEAAGEWMDEHGEEVIDDWLDDHPEATTTVQNNSITAQKIAPSFLGQIQNKYVTPEMFGAVGDGTTDDTDAFRAAVSIIGGSQYVALTSDKLYLITEPVYIDRPIHMVGAPNAVIKCEDAGCFVITDPNYDSARTYVEGDYAIITPEIGSKYFGVYNGSEFVERAGIPLTDKKWSAWSGTGSIFENVIFSWCDTVFTGDLRYLTFIGCKFTHNNTVFYCEGVSANKKSAWFGKIDITDCSFRQNREMFYLSQTNFDLSTPGNSRYTLSLNAVTIAGGEINSCNVFCQYPGHNDTQTPTNYLFRTESIILEGVDIEKTSFYGAFTSDPTDVSSDRTDQHYGYVYGSTTPKKWIGGLYIYNTVFQSCHIEQFSFLHHGFTPYDPAVDTTKTRGLIRSQVTFENCYMQPAGSSAAPGRRLIECDDVDNSGTGGMYLGNISETSFIVILRNCAMSINARETANADSSATIGSAHYLLDQNTFPLVRMVHSRYSVIYDNYKRNALLNTFEGRLPATVNSTATTVTVTVSQMSLIRAGFETAKGGEKVDNATAYAMAVLLANTDGGVKVNGLTGASSFSNDLKGTTDGLLNKNATEITSIINGDTATQQKNALKRFIDILNTEGNVVTVGQYLSDQNANDYIECAELVLDMNNNLANKRVMYRDIVPQYIGNTYRMSTTYTGAKTERSFLSQLPNGSFVTLEYPSLDVYYVANTTYGIQVLNIANAKDNLHYLVLSAAFSSTDFTGHTEYQDCTALKFVRFQFTPASGAMPSDMFSGCTALTDIYVPWAENAVTGAPWTDKTPAPTIHYNS